MEVLDVQVRSPLAAGTDFIEKWNAKSVGSVGLDVSRHITMTRVMQIYRRPNTKLVEVLNKISIPDPVTKLIQKSEHQWKIQSRRHSALCLVSQVRYSLRFQSIKRYKKKFIFIILLNISGILEHFFTIMHVIWSFFHGESTGSIILPISTIAHIYAKMSYFVTILLIFLYITSQIYTWSLNILKRAYFQHLAFLYSNHHWFWIYLPIFTDFSPLSCYKYFLIYWNIFNYLV